MRPWLSLLAMFWLGTLPPGAPGAGVEEFLGASGDYDPAVPRPATVLGYEVGEWHVRPDQLVAYLSAVAEASPRVELERTGLTHELRPLLLLTISSPSNLARIDTLRRQHVEALERGRADEGPVILWQGYSVHGNEASGANAAMLFVYHLAASRSDEVQAWLHDMIVLVDPALNPDGLGRFSDWVNAHHARNPVTDRNDREHHEAWPNGRTNHYGFDLNRDWLLLVHPESRARVEQYWRWRPHVVTDFHEMGSDATYFFQPGVPSRTNPWTPERNQELTRRIAAYHARVLDGAGQAYYSEETFDDYYYGKGSTYPDVNGAIGILFEQASARGRRIDTVHGELTFNTAIANQLRTSFSTLQAVRDLSDELKRYSVEFFDEALDEAREEAMQGYLIGDGGDPARAFHFLEILDRHGIEIRELQEAVEIGQQTFEASHAWYVPTVQPQYRLLESLMARPVEFADSTFYDVSTWTLPLVFNLPVEEVRGLSRGALGETVSTLAPPVGRLQLAATAVAYAIEWQAYYAPRTLQRLLDAELAVYVATDLFFGMTPDGSRGFDRGTLVVHVPDGDADDGTVEMELRRAAQEDGVDIVPLVTGLTPEGIDLGSPRMRRLEPVKPLLVVGRGVNGYEAGEVWHLLDTRVDLPLTRVDLDRVDDVDLDDYTHVILVDGRYPDPSGGPLAALERWVRDGGTLVATRRAAHWVTRHGLHELSVDEADKDQANTEAESEETKPAGAEPPEDVQRPYAAFRSDREREQLSGAIFEVTLDTTHPLGYGYDGPTLPVFRADTRTLDPSTSPYENVAIYTASPLLSGYASDMSRRVIAGSAAIVASRVGKGVVVRLNDNPNFRGVWYGTNRLFLNALYFSRLIDRTVMPED